MSPDSISRILVHYCWEQWTLSQHIISMIVDSIDKFDQDDLPGFFIASFHILEIEDCHRHARIQFYMEKFLKAVRSNLKYVGATTSCVRFLVRLSKRNRSCASWLQLNRSAWVWVEEVMQKLSIEAQDDAGQ